MIYKKADLEKLISIANLGNDIDFERGIKSSCLFYQLFVIANLVHLGMQLTIVCNVDHYTFWCDYKARDDYEEVANDCNNFSGG